MRKFKGDIINPELDFKGSVANRSNLSIATLPPIPKFNEDNLDNNQRRINSTELSIRKRMSIPVPPLPKSSSIVQRKRNSIQRNISESNNFKNTFRDINENENEKRFMKVNKLRAHSESFKDNIIISRSKINENSNTFFAKLGKRASTLGTFLKKVGHGDDNSLEIDNIILIPPAENRTNNLESEENNDNLRANFVKLNTKTQSDSETESIDGFISDSDAELDIINLERGSNVVAKGNKLNVHFANESFSSLISAFINSYSISGENTSNSQNDSSTYAISNQGSNSVFSFSDFSGMSSESTYSDALSSLSAQNTNIPLKEAKELRTTNYNRSLPSTPIKKMNQFLLRDYDNKTQNIVIIDPSLPPLLPKHNSFHHESTNVSSEFYDCDDFSFVSTKSSIKLVSKASSYHGSPNTINSIYKSYTKKTSTSIRNTMMSESPVKQPKKIQIPKDTSIYTRNPPQCKNYGNIKNNSKIIDDEKERSVSLQYLKKVGIEPFMLSGYQGNNHLKVTNPE